MPAAMRAAQEGASTDSGSMARVQAVYAQGLGSAGPVLAQLSLASTFGAFLLWAAHVSRWRANAEAWLPQQFALE